MEMEIITIYSITEEFLKALGYKDDTQTIMSTAEVITTAFVAARYYGGNHKSSSEFLSEHGYITRMLSKSRFNRRLHKIPVYVWRGFMELLARLLI